MIAAFEGVNNQKPLIFPSFPEELHIQLVMSGRINV